MRGRATPPHPGIYRVPPPLPGPQLACNADFFTFTSKVRVGHLFLHFYQHKFNLPLRPVLFLFIELIAAGGIVVLPSGRTIGVTVTSSHSMGT